MKRREEYANIGLREDEPKVCGGFFITPGYYLFTTCSLFAHYLIAGHFSSALQSKAKQSKAKRRTLVTCSACCRERSDSVLDNSNSSIWLNWTQLDLTRLR